MVCGTWVAVHIPPKKRLDVTTSDIAVDTEKTSSTPLPATINTASAIAIVVATVAAAAAAAAAACLPASAAAANSSCHGI
jgi:hypothetical protein